MTLKQTITATAAALALAAGVAVANAPAPTFTNTSMYRAVSATVTAATPGTYELDSTYFKLGDDPWGRVRLRATLAAGQTHTFTYRCSTTRATYGYRVNTPSGPGPSIWVKCQ